MHKTSKIISLSAIVFAACLCVGIAACGGPPPHSSSSDSNPLGHTVLTVEELRNETVLDAPTDSVFTMKFKSALTHFGRISIHNTGGPVEIRTFNDSLRLREEYPFRIRIFMSRDTLFAVSEQKHGAVQGGDRGEDTAMLECLFAGPAVRITLGDGTTPTDIIHMKSECAGGLYSRLDLPKILRSMIVRIPAEHRRTGAHWQEEALCPSFAGLGFAPHYLMTCRLEESAGDPTALVLFLETESPIGNIKTVLPNGEEASIVGGRYLLKGRLVVHKDSWSCIGGSLAVTETISYVRSALGPAVLDKNCDTRITLTVRWGS